MYHYHSLLVLLLTPPHHSCH